MRGSVTFNIFDSFTNRQVASISSDVIDDKAGAEWTYNWNEEVLNEKPKFTFVVTAQRCKIVESGDMEIGMKYEIPAIDENGEPLKNSKFTVKFSNQKSISVNSDVNGIIIIENEIPSEIISIEASKITGSIGEL